VSAQTVAQTIQFILAPVVMVSSCAILLTGFLARYAGINDRMRAMTQERLGLLRAAPDDATGSTATDPLVAERLGEIDRQLPELLRRHELVRDSVLVVYLAILVFVASMFVVAVATLTGLAGFAVAALGLFLTGTALLLIGVLLTASEVRGSHAAVEFEVTRVLSLGRARSAKDS